MAKKLRIQIKSAGEALEGFRDAFKAIEAGRRIGRREGVYFTSIEAARNDRAAGPRSHTRARSNHRGSSNMQRWNHLSSPSSSSILAATMSTS
jgi:hypothetical protein